MNSFTFDFSFLTFIIETFNSSMINVLIVHFLSQYEEERYLTVWSFRQQTPEGFWILFVNPFTVDSF